MHLEAFVLASMAKYNALVSLFFFFFFFTLALARVEPPTGHVLKGSVACLDCDRYYDLSGIQVLVQCNKIKKLASAYTGEDGTFEAELPSDTQMPPNSYTCQAKILGAPDQLYVANKNSISRIKRVVGSRFYTTSESLNFYTSCPSTLEKAGKCGAKEMDFGSSKTVDLPVPSEWGLAPTSYYAPFLPIIGIP